MTPPKLLYIAPFCHIPPADGGSQRGINLLEQLHQAYQVTLLTYRKHDAEALEKWCQAREIPLHWLPNPPEKHPRSYLGRLFSPQLPGFASHDPEQIARKVIDVWAAENAFDLLYYATQMMGQTAFSYRKSCPQVIDLYDVFTPIAQAKITKVPYHRPYHWLYRREARRLRTHERRLLKQFDLILVPSEEDDIAVRALDPQRPIAVVPNGVKIPPPRKPKPFGKTVLLVANFAYPPNAEGFRWFYRQVWQPLRIRESDISLLLVGQGSNTVRSITEGDHTVHWTDRVPDLAPYYQQADCAVVPVLSGGGTRLKLLVAMAWELPVVSTPFGAIGVHHTGSIFLANTAEAFSQQLQFIFTHPQEAQQKAKKGREIVKELYSWERIGVELRNNLEHLATKNAHKN